MRVTDTTTNTTAERNHGWMPKKGRKGDCLQQASARQTFPQHCESRICKSLFTASIYCSLLRLIYERVSVEGGTNTRLKDHQRFLWHHKSEISWTVGNRGGRGTTSRVSLRKLRDGCRVQVWFLKKKSKLHSNMETSILFWLFLLFNLPMEPVSFSQR